MAATAIEGPQLGGRKAGARLDEPEDLRNREMPERAA